MEKALKHTDDEIENLFQETWNLFKSGDENLTRRIFFRTVKDNDVDPRSLYEKYNEYIISLSEFQAGKYTKKEKQIKELYEFLQNKMYKLSFTSPVKRNIDRDKYLYDI